MQEKKQGDGASKSTPVSISDCASTVNATTSAKDQGEIILGPRMYI